MLQLFPDVQDTIHGSAAAVRAGTTSSVRLLDRCLAAIDEWEPSVRAWVSLDVEAARRTAAERDREICQGHDRGPLHGIPIGIKDIFDVAGQVTAAGSRAWARNAPQAGDCPVVARLREAGAILLGKTVTTQFACFDPPVTRNPWQTGHTPGGSSSGSAAAVATGMCLGAMGSQTGGSITRPAAFCGVAGYKPSYGTVSLSGVVPVAEHLDHPGPIARCVADLEIFRNVIQDTADPLGTVSAAIPPRVGWIHGLFDEYADADARAAVATAIEVLAAGGADVTDVALPAEFDDVTEQHRVVMAVEAAATHREHFAMDPEDYGPAVRSLVERGLATPRAQYKSARDHQQRLRNSIGTCFHGVDMLLCPAAVGTAPDLSTTGSPVMNSPWSYTGLPTVSIPIQLGDNGLPSAVQLVGKRDGDAALLQSAAWCESRFRAHG